MIRQLEQLTVTPEAQLTEYFDHLRQSLPPHGGSGGRVTFRTSALVEDNGQPDVQVWTAFQHQVQDLPDDVLLYLLPEPLLRSRQRAARHRLVACSANCRRVGRWCRAVCNFVHRPHSLRLHAGPGESHGPRSVSRADRRLPRLHAFGDRVLPQPECAGSVLHRLSRRHRRAATTVSDGFQRVVRSVLGRPLVRVSTPATIRRESAAS